MKVFIAFLVAVLASASGFAQEKRPANPVRILTAGQHITPYKIEVLSARRCISFFLPKCAMWTWEATTSSRAKPTGWRMWYV